MRDYHTDFDHMDDDFAGRLYEITDDLRRTCPVAHGSAHGGFVAISRYADVYAVAHDYATYSSAEGITLPPFGNPTPSVPLECDPPETRVYRNLLMPYLSPAAVQELEPAILGRIDGLLDAMESNGGGDLAEEFVVPLPAQVTCDLMGLPAEDGPQLVEWENACFKHQDPAAIAGLLEYLSGHLVDRRASPRDDMMTAIATFEVDGVPMPDDKAVAMSLLVAGAGFDTTAGGLGHLLRIIAADDSLRQGLIDKTLDISLMVEESLRFETPLQGVARKVRQPATLGDETVQPGDCCSARPTATPKSSRTPRSSIRLGSRIGTLPSVPACTPAWACTWPAPRCEWASSGCWSASLTSRRRPSLRWCTAASSVRWSICPSRSCPAGCRPDRGHRANWHKKGAGAPCASSSIQTSALARASASPGRRTFSIRTRRPGSSCFGSSGLTRHAGRASRRRSPYVPRRRSSLPRESERVQQMAEGWPSSPG
jgi:cytochrome P450